MSGMGGAFGGGNNGYSGGISPEYRNNELYVLGYSLFIGKSSTHVTSGV